jgi:hypothetical protein
MFYLNGNVRISQRTDDVVEPTCTVLEINNNTLRTLNFISIFGATHDGGHGRNSTSTAATYSAQNIASGEKREITVLNGGKLFGISTIWGAFKSVDGQLIQFNARSEDETLSACVLAPSSPSNSRMRLKLTLS